MLIYSIYQGHKSWEINSTFCTAWTKTEHRKLLKQQNMKQDITWDASHTTPAKDVHMGAAYFLFSLFYGAWM